MKPKTRHALLLACALPIAALAAREMGEPDLASEEFIKRFTASYGVLSEREPPLDDLEVAILRKLAPMMRVDREYAQTLLQSLTVAKATSSAAYNYLLGNIYFENEEYFLAEEQYKRAIEAFPDFQRAWTNLGVLKLRSDDTRSALIALLKAIELGDSQAQTFGMLGYCHYREGNYISASVAYDRAMLAQPDNLEWLEGKAQVYFQAERYIEAIRMQDELIARRPERIEYWKAQTNSYLAAGDHSRTARNLEIIRSLGQADFQSLFLLASLYTRLGVDGPAADAYLAAAEIAAEADLPLLAQAAAQLLGRGRADAARRIHQDLLRLEESLDPQARFATAMLGGDLATLDADYPAAIAAYEKAEQLDPVAGPVLIKLAQLNAQDGKRDKAYLLLARAELDPDAQYNALLSRISLLVEDERFAEAQTYISRALKIQSTEAMQNLYAQVQQAAQDTR